MTSLLQHRARLLLFLGALLVPLVVAEAPAEAQRSGASARRARRAEVRARRAQAQRRQVRNQRRRARRAAARARVQERRAQRRARRSGGNALAVSVEDETVDMDFSAELHSDAASESEAPPPMERYHVEEATRARASSALDPELYGEAGGAGAPGGPRQRSSASPLTVRAALRGVSRGISYAGRERGTLNDYSLPFGAALAMGADYYPAAHLTDDALAGLGLTWDAEHSLGLTSVGPNSIGYPTRSYAWNLGVRYRGVIDAAGSELAAEVGAGQRGFHVDRGSFEHPAPEGVPGVDYTQLRLGGAGRFVIGDVALGVRAAYLPVFDLGEIAGALGGGAHGGELGVSFSYSLGLGFSVLAEVDARVYGLSFAPPPESPVAASGAIDHHIGVNLGVEWRMPADASL